MLVICGPSGVGKGTLISRLLAEAPDKFGLCVSHTTRKPREGETVRRGACDELCTMPCLHDLPPWIGYFCYMLMCNASGRMLAIQLPGQSGSSASLAPELRI